MPTIHEYKTDLRGLRNRQAEAAIPFLRPGGLASDIAVAEQMAYVAVQADSFIEHLGDLEELGYGESSIRREAEMLTVAIEDNMAHWANVSESDSYDRMLANLKNHCEDEDAQFNETLASWHDDGGMWLD